MIVDEIHKTVHEKDRDYFRATREKTFGMPLEEFAANKEAKLEEFRKSLNPLRATLKAFDFWEDPSQILQTISFLVV